MTNAIYTIISVIIISLVSVLVILPLLYKKKIPKRFLLVLLSFSVGTLLGTVFIHFLPESVEHGYTVGLAMNIMLGFLAFFVLEKFIHWHHNKHDDCKHGAAFKDSNVHGHAYHLAPLNLIGDGVHNFLDGLVIAGAYAASVPLGIAATISVLFHEVPQELADFGILLYSGLTKLKAILFNLVSASMALVGAVIGIIMAGHVHGFEEFIIPFAAGNFLYIAASNLIPELHLHCKLKDSVLHLLMIMLGVALMAMITLFGPGMH